MHWMNDFNWFAIQTKPCQERLAAAHVAQLDAEVFLPQIRQEQVICGAERIVTKPLFPGHFFARFCPLISFDAVRFARGVLRVVGTSRCLIPVEPEIISSIQHRLQADGFIRPEPKPLHPGKKMTIEHGPLAGWMGRIEREWDDGRRVLILLEAIQQARLIIEKRWLAAAST